MAELSVYYCEQAIRFSREVGLDDGPYHDALVRMFEQALKAIMVLPQTQRSALLDRLQAVRTLGQSVGWGVGYAFNDFWHRAERQYDH